MNVLIIGGTGVLSSAVTNEALRQGFKVTMINRGSRSNLIPDNVEFLKSDKNDLKKIRHLLGERRFDAVMDYATLMMRWQIVSIFTLIIQSNIFLYLLVLFITPLWEKFVGRILLRYYRYGVIV